MICYVNSLWVALDSVCWMTQLKSSIIRFVFLCILQTWSRPIRDTAPRGRWGDGLGSGPPPTCRTTGQGVFHLEDGLPLCLLLEKSNVLVPGGGRTASLFAFREVKRLGPATPVALKLFLLVYPLLRANSQYAICTVPEYVHPLKSRSFG